MYKSKKAKAQHEKMETKMMKMKEKKSGKKS